ncbi:hypothetical protein CLONEX_01928 [[Clostridium] nexile DSM 1787]|nr:hypothetical protein CLONEX_01928 [[Clostridium] nexile DSM 1787]
MQRGFVKCISLLQFQYTPLVKRKRKNIVIVDDKIAESILTFG